MKHLKLAGAQWAGYTGNIGTVAFKDGVSTEPVPRAVADRLSAAMRMVEVDADGNEAEAGVAARLVHDSAQRATLHAPLARQTEDERKAEDRKVKAAANKAPAEIYSEEQLDAIIKKGGMKALRAVAEPWGVKGRAIPDLLKDLLHAQSKFINERDQRLETDTTPVTETPAAPEVVEENGASDEILAAAASGNLAAALNAPETPKASETPDATDGTEGETPKQPADDGVTGE